MIKPERSKRSLRFFNSCWRFLTHLKSKNKNKPAPAAEVEENVCGSKENIHGGQGEPLQQEVAELPVCDESFVTCDEPFVNNEEVIIADVCDTVYKESSPERVIEVEKDYVLPTETLEKTESSSSDDQFFYQPVSKRREVIEKRILSLKGDVPNVERILKSAEDEIKNRHINLAKWEDKDRQLIAPHPSEDCLPNSNKYESHNVEKAPTETTAAPDKKDNDKCENNSVVESSFISDEVIGEVCQEVESVTVSSNNEESGEVENLAQPSMSTKNVCDTDIKTSGSTKLNDIHSPITEPRKCISESLVNKTTIDKENDSSQTIPFPDVIENALENTEYMDEELQESGLEMNQFENNLDDISDGAQSQTYFSGEISTTPVTEKSYDDQSTSVQPLGRFAGLGDHNFEQMLNNSFTIFSVLEERMCEHGSEIVTSDENVEILPIESDMNANSVWEGDLTTPSMPMLNYAESIELPNEMIKNNTPEPLEQYFEFHSSHTSFQQELITESEELEKCEKSAEELRDNSCYQDLKASDSAEVAQVNETLNICEVTVKETVEEMIETPTFYLDVDSPSVHMMTEDYYKYPPFQTSTSFRSGDNQVGENKQQPEHTFDIQFQEQNIFKVSNEVEYNTVPETLDVYRITEKESADENIETPIFQLGYDAPPAEIVTNDYRKPNENCFEYDPFMNSPTFKPEINLESNQINQCQNQAEQNLDESFNGQFQENTNFGMPSETEYAETLDPYEVGAGESREENMGAQVFHLEFASHETKPAEHYFDYDPYRTSDNFKQDIIVESDPIDYVMDVGDNTQFREQNNFNMPNDIEDASSKENTEVFEINERKSFEQNVATYFYHVEYEPTELPKDPVEQYFDYGTSTFKSEIIVENNPVNYVCEDIQFEENSNIANSPEDSINDNLNTYKVSDEESFEHVEKLAYEVDHEDFDPDNSLQSQQYYQYDPFQSSVNFTQEILVECVRNENQPERTLDLGHNINIDDHFDYIESSNMENSQAGNAGFYCTGIADNIEVQKFNYESETDSHQTNPVTSDSQKPFEHYSEYDPFRNSVNLGPEIFVESYQTGGCQNATEKDTEFQHNELNLSNETENPIDAEIPDISQEIEQIPIEENKENINKECLFNMVEVNDHKNENYCHMEYEYENPIVKQEADTNNISRLNSENVYFNIEECTFNKEECKECFLPTNNEAIHENAGKDPKDNDWNKSESDVSWDFGTQDKTMEVDQLETGHDDVKEESDSNAFPEEITKEEPQNAVVSEPDAYAANVSDVGDSQTPQQTENADTEFHLKSAANCETSNEQNATEEPPQNDEAQKTRKKRNRKKKGKHADEEDKPKPEEAPSVEEKNEVDEQKDEPKEASENVDKEVNKTEEQVVTTNKRNRRKKKQNNQEEPPVVECTPVEEIPQEDVTNTLPPEATLEQEISQGTEQEAKKRRNRRKRR